MANPFLQRNASNGALGKAAAPTISVASLITKAYGSIHRNLLHICCTSNFCLADHHWQSSAGRIRVKAELLSFPSESSAPGANGENDEKTSKCGASQQLDGPDSESYAVKDSENANWC
jgi:hypothetical protein